MRTNTSNIVISDILNSYLLMTTVLHEKNLKFDRARTSQIGIHQKSVTIRECNLYIVTFNANRLYCTKVRKYRRCRRQADGLWIRLRDEVSDDGQTAAPLSCTLATMRHTIHRRWKIGSNEL
jgi:hypothetical protein